MVALTILSVYLYVAFAIKYKESSVFLNKCDFCEYGGIFLC